MLQQALAILKEVEGATSGEQAAFIGQMYTTTRLLFGHPIIGPVTAEVVMEFEQKHADVRAMVWNFDTESKRLASSLHGHLSSLHSHLLSQHKHLEESRSQSRQEPNWNLTSALLSLEKQVTLRGETITVLQLLKQISEASFVGDDNILLAINDATETAQKFLLDARGFYGPENEQFGREATSMLGEFRKQIQNTQSQAKHLTTIVESISLRSAIKRLKSFDQWLSSVLGGEYTSPEVPPLGSLRLELLLPLRILATRVLERLSAEGPIAHVLRRMKVHFEHFARDETEEEMKKEQGKPRREYEKVLQQKMDRFLFDDGIFPITHFSAARGEVDTLFIESEAVPKIQAATDSAIPPVLIELKQAVSLPPDPPTRDSEVRAKINDGRLQVQTYAAHISTLRGWRGLRSYVVVFYNGPHRYHVSADNVLLVYLGPKDASKGNVVLDLNSP